MKRQKSFFILMFILLTACSNPMDRSVIVSPTTATTVPILTSHAPSATSTKGLVVYTITPSATSPKDTPQPSQTPTMTVMPDYTVRCVEISAEVPFTSVAKSGVVLMTPLDSPPYLLDLSTNKQYFIPLTHPDVHTVDGGDVSPNGNSLAYVEFFDNPGNKRIIGLLRVVSADGQIKATADYENYWPWVRWLDNERFEIYWWDAPTPGTVILLNPFTGQREILSPTFPDFYSNAYDPAVWRVKYSSDLERVLYLSNADQYLGKAVLWDMASGNALWQHSEHGVGTIDQIPAWSPLGDQVAVVVGNHLFRVDRSGQAIPLPDFGEEAVGRFTWSPDGRHIAFWAGSQAWETRRLFILDTTSNQVVDLCLGTALAEGYPPLWSPDGLLFVIHIGVENADGSGADEVILVDIDRGKASRIPINELPTAWMRSMP